MSCPTCNHTMQNVKGGAPGTRVFWCPRCGTLKMESGEHNDIEPPRWTRLMRDAEWHEAYYEWMNARQAVLQEVADLMMETPGKPR